MQRQKFNLRLKILLILLLLSIIAWLVYILKPNKDILQMADPVFDSHPQYFSQLNGLPVASTAEQVPNIIGVMVDNHPDAWPQSCLGAFGSIVYEAPAEGVTTRFLQVMSANSDLSKVGPVRSARPYFLDWLAEYGDAVYMHCGGSPRALQLIKDRKVFDLNEFYFGEYYWRDTNKVAPHNLFTNREKWNLILSRYSSSSDTKPWLGWHFAKDIESSLDGNPVKEIAIKYYPGYIVSWRFQKDYAPVLYERLVNGDYQKSICATNENNASASVITAQNILIQFVQMETVDEVGRKEIETLGTGEAYILHNGLMIRGKWEKRAIDERTRFYNKEDKEITLLPGTTWVEVVPVGTSIEITN